MWGGECKPSRGERENATNGYSFVGLNKYLILPLNYLEKELHMKVTNKSSNGCLALYRG